MISFKDWLDKKESSAFTRSRYNAIMGIGPDIPLASLHSRSTYPIGLQDLKKHKKRKKKKKINESINKEIDNWLKSLELLKKDLEMLNKIDNKKKLDYHGNSEKTKKDKKDERGRCSESR